MALATNNLLFHSQLSGSDILGDTIRRLNLAKLTSLDFAHVIMDKHGVTSGVDHPHRSFIFRAFNDWQGEKGTATLASSYPNQRIRQQPLRNNTNEGGVMEGVPSGMINQESGVFKQRSVGATSLTEKQIGRLIQRKPLSSNVNGIQINSTTTTGTGDKTVSTMLPLSRNANLSKTARGLEPGHPLRNLTSAWLTARLAALNMTLQKKAPSSHRLSPPDLFKQQTTTISLPDGQFVKAPSIQAFTPAYGKNTTSEETNRDNPITAAIPPRLSVSLPLVYKRIGTNSIISRLSTEHDLKSNISNRLLSPVSSRGLLIQRKPLMSYSYGVNNQTISTSTDGVKSAGRGQRSSQGTFAPETLHAKGIERILSTATTSGSNAVVPGKDSFIRSGIPRTETDSITHSILTPDFNHSIKNVEGDSSTLVNSAPPLSFFTAPDLSHRIWANSLSTRLIKQALLNTSRHQTSVRLPLNPVVTRGMLAKHEPLLSNTTKLNNPTKKSYRNFNMAKTKNLYAVPSLSPINNEESRILRLEGKMFAENLSRPQLTLVSNAVPQLKTPNIHSTELTLHTPKHDRLLSSEPILEVSQLQPQEKPQPQLTTIKSEVGVSQHSSATTQLSAEAMADKVYQILERRLTIERERRGVF